jgi:rRNA maturation protein Nop10
MIPSPRKQEAGSILIIPSPIGRRSSSFGSTTSVCGSKVAPPHPRSVSPSKHHDDRRPTKKVSFNRKVRAKLVPNVNCFSEKERSNMWYSSAEYTEIRLGAIKTVKKMAKNKSVDLDPNDSSRGLEGRTPKQGALRQDRRRIIMLSVLSQQLETRLDDYESSSRAISTIYAYCNRSCTYEAERRGKLDAIEASTILEMPYI